MKIYQLCPDTTSLMSIKSLLNKNSDKRIKKKVLDFYRNGVLNFLKDGGDIIIIAAYTDINDIVAISAASVRNGATRESNPLTVVDKGFRNRGLGSNLLDRKLDIFRNRYPSVNYRVGVADDNTYAINMCMKVGLCAVDSGVNKTSKTEYTVFEI